MAVFDSFRKPFLCVGRDGLSGCDWGGRAVITLGLDFGSLSVCVLVLSGSVHIISDRGTLGWGEAPTYSAPSGLLRMSPPGFVTAGSPFKTSLARACPGSRCRAGIRPVALMPSVSPGQ